MVKRMFWDDEGVSEAVYRAFCDGQLVLGDSDTVLGLYAPVSATGKLLLDDIKGRSRKPYVILAANAQNAKLFIDDRTSCFSRDLLATIMDTCWPGPLTLVCKACEDTPQYAMSELGTIAIRVPLHEGLQKLLARIGNVFSTSANKSGDPVPASIDQVDRRLLTEIACIVLNKTCEGGAYQEQPSTIIDCTGTDIRLIREGAYAIARLERELGITIT